MSKPRLIAFYLPQFYPTKENDEWWQKGFTEWTNVGSAKPLFKGHCQPRVPADLGYYDLRVPEVREEQAQLAREAGIEGFCYWHYWFAGRRLLDRVFREVVEDGKPDYPFCLCWANHSWYQKTWDHTKPDKLLIEQTYPGKLDYIEHFNAMLPAFRDKRYIKVDDKLLFGIYDPIRFDDFECFSDVWNDLAAKNGLNGFYFYGFTFRPSLVETILDKGYSSVVVDNIAEFKDSDTSLRERLLRRFFHRPKVLYYDDYSKWILTHFNVKNNVHPCVNPNFDHSPRSGERGVIICDHTPKKWESLLKDIFQKCKDRPDANNLVFIKAWNEWGEGNYLEPDMQYGKGFIQSTRRSLDAFI